MFVLVFLFSGEWVYGGVLKRTTGITKRITTRNRIAEDWEHGALNECSCASVFEV